MHTEIHNIHNTQPRRVAARTVFISFIKRRQKTGLPWLRLSAAASCLKPILMCAAYYYGGGQNVSVCVCMTDTCTHMPVYTHKQHTHTDVSWTPQIHARLHARTPALLPHRTGRVNVRPWSTSSSAANDERARGKECVHTHIHVNRAYGQQHNTRRKKNTRASRRAHARFQHYSNWRLCPSTHNERYIKRTCGNVVVVVVVGDGGGGRGGRNAHVSKQHPRK